MEVDGGESGGNKANKNAAKLPRFKPIDIEQYNVSFQNNERMQINLAFYSRARV